MNTIVPVALIALDLDDTLLRSDLHISEANREAIVAAEDEGIELVLASGRSYAAMKRYVDFLGLARPGNFLICSNGAEILDAESGEARDRLFLSESFCHETAKNIEDHGFQWQVYMDGKIWCSKLNPWAFLDERLSGQQAVEVTSREELFRGGQIKFVIPGEEERIAELYGEFSRFYKGKAEVVTSKPYFLEILPIGADKGSALRRLAAQLAVPMDAVMAVGDAMNDYSMVKAAGWGCAPANALEAIKAIARVISDKTNEEDAVADLIYSVALRQPSRRGRPGKA
ncbi:MAG TPA: Cof-type HAD-IIB family hydrolase [Spirochaetaceae bacterium]|nr:Cof-type HAD-IIB family hydrolase [Spirochaetaceae bacterium]